VDDIDNVEPTSEYAQVFADGLLSLQDEAPAHKTLLVLFGVGAARVVTARGGAEAANPRKFAEFLGIGGR